MHYKTLHLDISPFSGVMTQRTTLSNRQVRFDQTAIPISSIPTSYNTVQPRFFHEKKNIEGGKSKNYAPRIATCTLLPDCETNFHRRPQTYFNSESHRGRFLFGLLLWLLLLWMLRRLNIWFESTLGLLRGRGIFPDKVQQQYNQQRGDWMPLLKKKSYLT